MYEVEDGKLKLEHGFINEGLIAVASGKGGVGKSTVTANMAVALSKLDKKVGIIDADVHGFSIPRIIGLEEKVRVVDEEEIIPPQAKGVKVISMGSFVEENDPVVWRAPLLAGALEQFMKDVQWGELDYLLFDLPPGTGDMALNILQKLPHAESVIVTTPQVTAANVAGRIGKLAERMEASILGIVENMSYYECPECGTKEHIFGKGGGEELAEKLKTEFLGQLPLVTEIRESGDRGVSVVDNEKLGQSFLNIARNVIDNVSVFDPDKEPITLKK